MTLTGCRARFAEYVADTVRLSVHFQHAGQSLPGTMTVSEEFDLRVVTSNHPGGVPDSVPSDDPPQGSNLQDVRLHLQVSDADLVRMLVDASLENTTFRSGWDVDAEILTPGDWVGEMFVHFAAEHPTFDLPTDDPLDDFTVRGRAYGVGRFHITATARVTPRWRELSNPAQSSTVLVAP